MVGNVSVRRVACLTHEGRKVRHSEHVYHKLGELEHSRRHGPRLFEEVRLIVKELFVEYPDHAGTRARGRDDVTVAREGLQEPPGQRYRLTPKARVEGRLPAARLRRGEVDVDAKASQDADRALAEEIRYVPQLGLTELAPEKVSFNPRDAQTLMVVNRNGRIDLIDVSNPDRPIKMLEIRAGASDAAKR